MFHYLAHQKKCKKIISLLIFVLVAQSGQTQNQKPLLTLPLGHQQTIFSVEFSKDGRLMATGSSDNSFILWDTKTGYLIRRTHTDGPVLQVLFTPDDSQLITLVGQSDAIYLKTQKPVLQKWDIKTGKLVQKLPFSASAGLRFLHDPGYLLVPDYSDSLTKDSKSLMPKIDYSDPNAYNKMVDDATSDKNAERLADEYLKKAEEIKKKYTDADLRDPKKMQEYSREVAAALMGDVSEAGMFNRNITLVDFKTLKPVSSLKKVPKSIRSLYYNNTEYILGEYEKANVYEPSDPKIAAWDIREFISQFNEKRKIKSTKEFKTGRSVTILETSPAKGLFAADSVMKAILVWHIDNKDPVARLSLRGQFLNNFGFSRDGNLVYVNSRSSTERYIEAWNTSTFQRVLSLALPKHYLGANSYLSPQSDYFIVNNSKSLIKISLAGESLNQFQGRTAIASYAGFKENDNTVYVNYNGAPDMSKMVKEGMEQVIEQEAKAQNKTLTKAEKEKILTQRMRDMKIDYSAKAYNGFLLNWDLVRGGARFEVAGPYSEKHTTTSADNNYQVMNQQMESANKEDAKMMPSMIKASQENLSKEDAEKMKDFNDPNSYLYKMATASSYNGPVTLLINRKTRDTISLINIDSTDWIILLKSGYYMTSRNGARALSYTRNLEVLPFEQFDIKYNRPDIVLKAIGKADPALIEAYCNAYQKRIKKLDIDTLQFKDEYNVPEADFGNRDKIDYDQKTGKLTLVITASDSKTNLNRYNIWVNEVPVFGRNGKSIKEAKSNKLNTGVEITLSQGINRIETSVINNNGVESYRSPLIVKYNPSQLKTEKVYFIGLGINRFADTSHNLQYCEKDIRDLSEKLKEKYGANIQVDLLFNEEVTMENVKSLKKKLLQSNEDDKVIIAYSGHGLLSKSYDYYLSTYNVNFNQPEQNGLPYDELENLVDGIKARKKLLMIDACHSGEVDKEDMQKIAAVQADLKKENNVSPDSRGIKLPPSQNNKLGTKNSFELMQELFVNVGRGTGTTIISAAAGTQFALERGDLKNGVFTYSVLELLKTGKTVTVNELKKHVSSRVSELTKGLQQPTTRNETQNVDWIVW